MPLLPLLYSLLGGLVALIGPVVARVLIALGIGFVTYTGSQIGIDAIFAKVQSAFSGAPSQVVGLLGFLWVDKAISVVFSAFAVSLAIKSAAGSITKMVLKGKS